MEEHQLEVKAVTDAKKETIVAAQGLNLATEATKIHAAKGKKLVSFTLKAGKLQGEATDDDLRKAGTAQWIHGFRDNEAKLVIAKGDPQKRLKTAQDTKNDRLTANHCAHAEITASGSPE